MAGAPNDIFHFNLENAAPGNSTLIRACKQIDFLIFFEEIVFEEMLANHFMTSSTEKVLFLGFAKKKKKKRVNL